MKQDFIELCLPLLCMVPLLYILFHIIEKSIIYYIYFMAHFLESTDMEGRREKSSKADSKQEGVK